MYVKQVNWRENKNDISSIRRAVFINEQQVSEADEWDEHDEKEFTTHLLAYIAEPTKDKDQAIGTARILASGKIGRIAVLKDHRQQGIGKELVKQAASCALIKSPNLVYLDSQIHATDFYRSLGFIEKGTVFMDAGIEHVRMLFDISPQNLHFILNTTKQNIENTENACSHLYIQSKFAKKNMDIFSNQLNMALFGQSTFVDAVSALARRSRYSRIRILIKDSSALKDKTHPLIALAQRLSSHIDIHTLNKAAQNTYIEGSENSYVNTDNQSIVLFTDEEKAKGYAQYSAKSECKRLTNSFNNLWNNHSEPDINLRRLAL